MGEVIDGRTRAVGGELKGAHTYAAVSGRAYLSEGEAEGLSKIPLQTISLIRDIHSSPLLFQYTESAAGSGYTITPIPSSSAAPSTAPAGGLATTDMYSMGVSSSAGDSTTFSHYPSTPAALQMLHHQHQQQAAMAGVDPGCEQMKREKELIYSHPLFPLLTLLFQKCELATCTPREPPQEGGGVDPAAHLCSAASFDEDVMEFKKTVQGPNKPFYVPNPELDSLVSGMIKVGGVHW